VPGTAHYLIALARENGAELIVSGDKDLLEWKPQQPTVITPSEFEQRIRTD
jgi:predicted nucleic acid-binding protein